MADDNGDSRQLLCRVLQTCCQAEVVEARTGPHALDEFRCHAPCISFLDIDMPELDGLAVLREIRSEAKDAFVVIVSATSSLQNVKQAMAWGAGGFVVKPYSAARIIDLLRVFEASSGAVLLTSDAG
nr:response regulator [uncultured Caldimonas sp.]